MKKVSVIVPIYKVEKYLDRCIASICAQTYQNLEILLVDDGSPDRCGEICDKWKEKDDRIVVIHKENGGISSARNAALDIMTGDYVGCVDSDDFIAPYMYEELVQNLEKFQADMIFFRFQNFRSENEINYERTDKESSEYSIRDAMHWLYASHNDIINMASNKLYRRELFDGLRYREGILNEDAYIITYILERCKRIVKDDNVLYYRQLREDSIMGKLKKEREEFDRNSLHALFYMRDRVERYRKTEDRELYSKMCMEYLHTLIMRYSSMRKYRFDKTEQKKLYDEFCTNYAEVKKEIVIGLKMKIKFEIFYRFPGVCSLMLRILKRV